MVSMNTLTIEKRVQILASLIEGNSIRSTVRMIGAAKNTVVKLLRDVGQVCEQYHDRVMINLPCKRIQVDEIWSFCYAEAKSVREEREGDLGYGDVRTWVAIDAGTKLILSRLVGLRTAEWAETFNVAMFDKDKVVP